MPRRVPCSIVFTIEHRYHNSMYGVLPWHVPCLLVKLKKNQHPSVMLSLHMFICTASGDSLSITNRRNCTTTRATIKILNSLSCNNNNYDKLYHFPRRVQYGTNGTRHWCKRNTTCYDIWDLCCIGSLRPTRINSFYTFVVRWNWIKYRR